MTFCGAVVMKVMDQLKTLVKRRWSDKVRRTVYILTLSEFARHEFSEFTNLWLETLPDTLSLSLTGIRHGPKQARRVNDSTASLSLAERWTITEIRRQSNSVLSYSLLCLVPVRRVCRPSRSMHFGDVSETNGRETPRQSRSAHALAFLPFWKVHSFR